MITIENTLEKIYILNTTFENEYGFILDQKGKNVIVELTHKEKGYKFTRAFSKKTGKAHGYNLKILW